MQDKDITKELSVQENGNTLPAQASPAMMMQLAMDKNLDLSKVEKMIELQAKWDAIEAKKAYTLAMAQFKKEPPIITKDKSVGYTNNDGSSTGYKHASLGNVTNTINTALAKHGFSAGWKKSQEEGKITVTCTITHKKGHSESTSLTAPADSSGKKNPIQAIGSTVTYLERYTLLALTGLATHDQDDDGVGAGPEVEYITEKQKSEIRDMMADTNTDEVTFLNYLKANSIDEIPAKSYRLAITALNKKKEKLEKMQ